MHCRRQVLLLFLRNGIELSLTVPGDDVSSFWDGKMPCWGVCGCSKYVCPDCTAYLNHERPCWESAYTQSEILPGIKRDCPGCKVFKLYCESKTHVPWTISPMKNSS